MGYTTDFTGSVTVEPPLNAAEIDYLKRFADSRRMQRRGGPYDTSEPDRFSPEIIEYNYWPEGQHSLWCDWEPTADGTAIEWNGVEKFHDADAWMRYLIDTFLKPGAALQAELGDRIPGRVYDPMFGAFTFNHVVNGTIDAQGEDDADTWQLVVTDNQVERVKVGAVPNSPMTDTPRHPLAQIARECGITVADVRKTLIADSYAYHDRATSLIAGARLVGELTEGEGSILDAYSAATSYAYLLAALLRIVEDRHGEDEALGMACMVDAVRESGTDVLEDANHDIDERANEVAQ